MVMLGSPNPSDLMREGDEEGQEPFPWALGRSSYRRGEDAVSQWRKELPGKISQTPVKLQSNLSNSIS